MKFHVGDKVRVYGCYGMDSKELVGRVEEVHTKTDWLYILELESSMQGEEAEVKFITFLKRVFHRFKGHRFPLYSECGWFMCSQCGCGYSEWGEWMTKQQFDNWQVLLNRKSENETESPNK